MTSILNCNLFLTNNYTVRLQDVNLHLKLDAVEICSTANNFVFIEFLHHFTNLFSQVICMLAVDSFVSILTWLPVRLMYAITAGSSALTTRHCHYTWKEICIMDGILNGIMLFNCFSSPIIYFGFNSAFRVSVKSRTNSLSIKYCGLISFHCRPKVET